MGNVHFDDPPCMPRSRETAQECLARGMPLAGTPGQRYLERRGISVELAGAQGLRFDADFGGRPAVFASMRDRDDTILAVHGRYLETLRGQDKMLTVGSRGGVMNMLGGWRIEPMILVEGMFDALSLAMCGWASVATIGRWAPWLPEVAANRTVWLAFDGNRPGEAEAARYRSLLEASEVRRLSPPGRSKDWNTALLKYGRSALQSWLRKAIGDQQRGLS